MITIKKTLCPDATYTVQYEDATPITSGSIVSGGSALIEVPNCTAGGSVGATIMKTGATTVYRTGDDASTSSEGRAVDFYTLDGLNPFGTSIRLTDELGSQTFTNNIVIDWSTYNGATVLGVYRLNIASRTPATWNQAIDNSLVLSVGTFTTGWRLWNKNEAFNFMIQGSLAYGYSPLNSGTGNTAPFWTSDTYEQSNTNAFLARNDGSMTLASKVSLAGYPVAVRTFTVTGTTLS